MKPSVCAVVVTFNRKSLLVCTLSALGHQESLDKIIIIDNASTDGTQDYLAEQGFLAQPHIEYHKLGENTGGAGGFYQGVKLGFEQGFDYLWLMDDDGYPADDCLDKLLNYREQFDFFGPLVLSDDNKEHFSFPMTLPVNKKVIRSKNELFAYLNSLDSYSPILHDVLIPFNGVLLNSQMIEQLGFPDKRFFIWGDDMEYTKRIQKHGGTIATIADIEFYHPTTPNLGTPMFFGKMQFNDTDSQIKLYCLCRNNTYNLKHYYGAVYALLFVIKTIWFYCFTRPSWQKLMFCLPALWHGLVADFSHHHRYIGKNFG